MKHKKNTAPVDSVIGAFVIVILTTLLSAAPLRAETIRLTAVSWRDAFDRAEARSEEQDPRAMLNDWLADELWAIKWTHNFTFAHTRADLATRAQIALDLAASREKEGARADRAMAEAITCTEVVGFRPEWQKAMLEFEL